MESKKSLGKNGFNQPLVDAVIRKMDANRTFRVHIKKEAIFIANQHHSILVEKSCRDNNGNKFVSFFKYNKGNGGGKVGFAGLMPELLVEAVKRETFFS